MPEICEGNINQPWKTNPDRKIPVYFQVSNKKYIKIKFVN